MPELKDLVGGGPDRVVTQEPETLSTFDEVENELELETPEEADEQEAEEPENPEEDTGEDDEQEEKPEPVKPEPATVAGELSITGAALRDHINPDKEAFEEANKVLQAKLKEATEAVTDKHASVAGVIDADLKATLKRLNEIETACEDEGRSPSVAELRELRKLEDEAKDLQAELEKARKAWRADLQKTSQDLTVESNLELHTGLKKYKPEYSECIAKGFDLNSFSPAVAVACCMVMRAEKTGKPLQAKTKAQITSDGIAKSVTAKRAAAIPAARGNGAGGGGAKANKSENDELQRLLEKHLR